MCVANRQDEDESDLKKTERWRCDCAFPTMEKLT
jgi:hypothetical protein